MLAVNDAPEVAEGTVNPFTGMDEDGTLPISRGELLSGFSDVESENTELTINNLAVSAGFISGNDSDGWTYTPADDFNGEVTISYAVSDPDGGTTLAAYSFTVAAINDGPEFKGSEPITLANIQEDSELVFTESQLLNGFSDRDGDTLSVTGLAVNTANAGTIDGDATNGYTFTANPNYNGPVELTYSVTDGTESTSATASFNVFSVNDAPELNGENYKSAIASSQPQLRGLTPETISALIQLIKVSNKRSNSSARWVR